MNSKFYLLPELPYKYNDLQPYISEEQLSIHHQKHHQAYVTAANAILEKIDKDRKENSEFNAKATLKDFSFNVGGHILHSLFWENLAPVGRGGGGEPNEETNKLIISEFESIDRFKKEFTQAALSVEGSGWAVLTCCGELSRPLIMQIEKHNTNIYPGLRILMVLDMFEHSYYIDYKNEKAKYIDAFWNIVYWGEVEERLSAVWQQ